MGKRTVHSHSRLSAPHGQHQSGFGSFVTYGADVDGDGIREMIAGTTNGGLYSVFTGTNRSGVRRWMRKIQEPSSASSSSTLLPTVGARPVALLGNMSLTSDLPLYWLVRERPRNAWMEPSKQPRARASSSPLASSERRTYSSSSSGSSLGGRGGVLMSKLKRLRSSSSSNLLILAAVLTTTVAAYGLYKAYQGRKRRRGLPSDEATMPM